MSNLNKSTISNSCSFIQSRLLPFWVNRVSPFRYSWCRCSGNMRVAVLVCQRFDMESSWNVQLSQCLSLSVTCWQKSWSDDSSLSCTVSDSDSLGWHCSDTDTSDSTAHVAKWHGHCQWLLSVTVSQLYNTMYSPTLLSTLPTDIHWYIYIYIYTKRN